MSQNKLSVAEHLIRQQQSGLSISEYCQQSEVSRSALYARMHFQRTPLKISKLKQKRAHQNSPQLTFTQLTPVPALPPSPDLIKLVFPNDIHAYFPAGFLKEDLQKIVASLTETSTPQKPTC